jgi:hypothetical protein
VGEIFRGALSWFEEQFEGVIVRELKRLHGKQANWSGLYWAKQKEKK